MYSPAGSPKHIIRMIEQKSSVYSYACKMNGIIHCAIVGIISTFSQSPLAVNVQFMAQLSKVSPLEEYFTHKFTINENQFFEMPVLDILQCNLLRFNLLEP